MSGRRIAAFDFDGTLTRRDTLLPFLTRACGPREVGRVIGEGYELGALGDGSGIPGFYQRLGWETWQGPTWVAGPDGPERTAEEDGSILVLRTPATGELDLAGPITCDWRAGDVW